MEHATASLPGRGTTRHTDLWAARGVLIACLVLAFPAATLAVFAVGADRVRVADVLSVTYAFAMFLVITTSLWPLPSLRSWTRFQRIESMCLMFLFISYITHVSWELGWVFLHEAIAEGRDAPWAYVWWAYIDGGDTRYLEPAPAFLMMEVLSVLNGLIGLTGLYLWLGRGDARGLLLCMATAVVHVYSTWLYYGGEILAGLPSVDTSRFIDTWIKFGLANAPWLIFPWFVLYWGVRRLRGSEPPS